MYYNIVIATRSMVFYFIISFSFRFVKNLFTLLAGAHVRITTTTRSLLTRSTVVHTRPVVCFCYARELYTHCNMYIREPIYFIWKATSRDCTKRGSFLFPNHLEENKFKPVYSRTAILLHDIAPQCVTYSFLSNTPSVS